MGPNQLYLPPLSSATVGILQPKPGADVTFTILPTWQAVGADIAFYVLGQVLSKPIRIWIQQCHQRRSRYLLRHWS